MSRGEQSGRTRAYDYLRERLLTDPSLPGTFVNEQDTALEIGVSRTPVREALLMLSVEHLVQLVPHRGAFVPNLTGTQVAEVLQARELIESACARSAIDAGLDPAPEMARLVDLQCQSMDVTGPRFIELDRDFHAALVASTGNAVIMDMYEALRMRHVLIGVQAVERDTARLHHVITEHRRIVTALEQGDVEATTAAISAHLHATHHRFVTS